MFFRYMEVRDVEEIWEMDQALFGSMAYSRQDFLRAVEGKYDRAIVLMEEEEILGYAILRVLGVEGELESIAVKKKHQGKGFGKQLLREILSIGDREAIQKIFLEVRESNDPARARRISSFFQKKGVLPRSGRGCHPYGKDDTINYVRIMFTGNRRNDASSQTLAHQLNVTL